MRKRIIGIVLCLALMCTLLPCAFAEDPYVQFDPTKGTFSDGSSGVKSVTITDGTVTAPTATRTGYSFKCWTIAGTEAAITENPILLSTYGIQSGNTLTAVWEAYTYNINPKTLPVEGYSIRGYKKVGSELKDLTEWTAETGTSVLVQFFPDSGYQVKSVVIEGTDGAIATKETTLYNYPAYSFTMPASNVTLDITMESTVATGIALDKSSLSLNTYSGSVGTVTATVTPESAGVTWSSDDTEGDIIALTPSADGKTCTVTAEGPGTAVITATSGEKSAACTVTVKGASISFTLPTAKFTSTDSYKIAAVTVPDSGTITWVSSNPTVMKVVQDSTDATGKTAVLYPLSTGSVQITAKLTTADGSVVSSSQSTTVAITSQTYKVTYNANGSWYYDAPSSYQIKVNAPYSKTIKSISIYNSQLGSTYYPVIGTDVSKTYDVSDPYQYTILTFTKSFMQTLPRYTYQILKITFEDGTASTYLHILSSTGRPITGDVQFNPYWIALAAGAAGLGAVITLRKKEDNFQ